MQKSLHPMLAAVRRQQHVSQGDGIIGAGSVGVWIDNAITDEGILVENKNQTDLVNRSNNNISYH